MSSQPPLALEPPKDGRYESSLDSIPLIKNAKEIRKFFKTRKAVIDQERLYNLTQDEIKTNGWMGPWAFNATQSLICSIPGMIVSGLLGLLLIEQRTVHGPFSDPVAAKVYNLLSPLQPPFTLLLAVYIIAFSSLPGEYMSVRNWKSAMRKYLFLDATYGLWPQLVLALCIAILSIPGSLLLLHPRLAYLNLAALVGLIAAFVWEVVLIWGNVRPGLFEYDYVGKTVDRFTVMDNPPTFRFFLLTTFVLPAALLSINVVLRAISFFVAYLVHKVT